MACWTRSEDALWDSDTSDYFHYSAAAPLHNSSAFAHRRRDFEVTLPPPGHPEFVVPQARFDAAIGREWAAPQRCQVRVQGLSPIC